MSPKGARLSSLRPSGPQVTEVILQALSNPSESILSDVLSKIRKVSGDLEPVIQLKLVELLRHHKAMVVKRAATKILAEQLHPCPGLEAPLLEAFTLAPTPLKNLLCPRLALLSWAGFDLVLGHFPKAPESVANTLHAHGPHLALRRLRVEAFLQHPKKVVRLSALELVSHMGSQAEPTIPILIRIIRDVSETLDIREAAIAVCIDLGHVAFGKPVAEALLDFIETSFHSNSRNHYTTGLLIKALAEQGPLVVSALDDMRRSNRPPLRMLALCALLSIVPRLRDNGYVTRMNAEESARFYGATSASLPTLESAPPQDNKPFIPQETDDLFQSQDLTPGFSLAPHTPEEDFISARTVQLPPVFAFPDQKAKTALLHQLIREGLQDPEESVRFEMAQFIGDYGPITEPDPQLTPILLSLIESSAKDWFIQVIYIHALRLAPYPDPALAGFYKSVFRQGTSEAKTQICRVMALQRGAPDALQSEILEMAMAPVTKEQVSIFNALNAIDSRTVALETLVHVTTPRKEVIQRIQRLAATKPKPNNTQTVERWHRATNLAVVWNVVTPAISKVIHDSLQSEDNDIRLGAAVLCSDANLAPDPKLASQLALQLPFQKEHEHRRAFLCGLIHHAPLGREVVPILEKMSKSSNTLAASCLLAYEPNHPLALRHFARGLTSEPNSEFFFLLANCKAAILYCADLLRECMHDPLRIPVVRHQARAILLKAGLIDSIPSDAESHS